MTAVVKELLTTFDQMTDSEQLEVASKVLQRVIHWEFLPLSDEDLVLNAENIFLELDQQETAYE